MDPTKVFLGQLWPDINKPDVQDWLARKGIRGWTHIYMFKSDTGPQCCFVRFDTVEHAVACTVYNGDEDPALTASRIQASIIVTQHGSL